jgi:hypothetical protein
MRYALLVCQDEATVLGAEEQAARYVSFTRFIDEMLAEGVLHDRGVRLRPTSTGTW